MLDSSGLEIRYAGDKQLFNIIVISKNKIDI